MCLKYEFAIKKINDHEFEINADAEVFVELNNNIQVTKKIVK